RSCSCFTVRPRYSVSTAPADSLNDSTISATAAVFSGRAMGLLPYYVEDSRRHRKRRTPRAQGPGRGPGSLRAEALTPALAVRFAEPSTDSPRVEGRSPAVSGYCENC